MSERLRYIDIAKGFGIICIVWGHTGVIGATQMYGFHIALFFFLERVHIECK